MELISIAVSPTSTERRETPATPARQTTLRDSPPATTNMAVAEPPTATVLTLDNLFYFFSLLVFLVSAGAHTADQLSAHPQDYLLCRQCGRDAADLNYLVHVKSPFSLLVENQTISRKEVPVQTLKNHLDVHFNVITLKKSGCIGLGVWQSTDTWFPGYLWKVCVCHRCGQHLGWVFEPVGKTEKFQVKASEKGFYAIVLDNVLSEEFSNSLIIQQPFKS